MQDLDDDNFDALLREHFAAELEPHRRPLVLPRRETRWRIVAFSGALAAGIALLVTLPAWRTLTAPRPGHSVAPTIVQASRDPSVEHEMNWNTIDQGTVLVNGDVPMRQIRRQRTDDFRWVDPQTNATMQMSVPHDEVILVGLHAN